MRDWLTVIIVLLIVGIILDAIRRVRQARRESLKLSKNAEKADREGLRVSDSEFPSGGARVVGHRPRDEAVNLTQQLRYKSEQKKITAGAPNKIPEQVTLNLDEHVPMLMDSVEEKADDDNVEIEKRHSQSDSAEVDVFADASDHKEPSLGDLDSLNEFDTVPEKPVSSAEDGFTAAVKKVENEEKIERERKTTAVKSQSTNLDSGDDLESDGKPLVDPEEVLIINVMAPNGVRFAGEDLLEVLVAQGMKLGAMDIFHRHLNDDGDGPILFSLANMVVPGTFNLAAMKDFETPGVSIFLSLPLAAIDENGGVPEGLSIQAYDNMASTAKALAAALGGDLKDENRSVMTLQTIEHGRQRVVEFERKQRLARA